MPGARATVVRLTNRVTRAGPMARIRFTLVVALALTATAGVTLAQPTPYARHPRQPVDEAYTRKLAEYTTDPRFTSPLVDYLPASKTVPTPMAVLGDVAGAPGKLPYTAEVHAYMRRLESASPRVRVFSIGQSEEGREMIAVAVSSEANIAALDENRRRITQLADPRTLDLDDARAERLVTASVPVYYITGAIHATETGSPTALMELAYRLAVDEAPYIQSIRRNVVTLITPVTEVDGRDRQVDVYNWHLRHPDAHWPPLVYWGKYVAHDNNRDAMALSLNLTRNVLATLLHWKVQVLHDLHESVPYLYDNTVGDGPYNPWLDPILTDEWQLIGWHNVAEMTKLGMPGVFTHGTFDTWSPGYLMFLAANHNGISRLYETFGNAGADTVERTLKPDEYARTWFRQNPPLPKARWSQRNNNNYQETALLLALHHFGENRTLFLRNFYLKSKRSILKARTEGPAAYVFPADDPRPGARGELLRLLQTHGVEVSRAPEPFTASLPSPPRPAPAPGSTPADDRASSPGDAVATPPAAREFPAGSYVVRMDQPYSRVADMLLDTQYWSPNDPQRTPYDDTGWTFPALFHVQAFRVTDPQVLEVPMERLDAPVRPEGGVRGTGPVLLVNHQADTALATLRFRFRDLAFEVAEAPFEAEGIAFRRGSFIIRGADRDAVDQAARELGITVRAVAAAPAVPTHPARAPRIAFVHTWLTTQTEGWWRETFDRLQIPYDYISTQDVGRDGDLRSRYDVLVFAPVGRSSQLIIQGLPRYGNPLPWLNTPETPNLGRIDETDDMRPGLGWTGLEHLRTFVERGGVLITAADTASLAVEQGFAPGVTIQAEKSLKMVGIVAGARLVDDASPIAYGYDEAFAIHGDGGPLFSVSALVGGRSGRDEEASARPTGRGSSVDPDQPQGRPPSAEPDRPRVNPWEAPPVTDEQRRNGILVIPPARRPRVVVRWADQKDLLVSGLLEGESEIAQRPAVIDSPLGEGHVVLFASNPIWRGATRGSYFLVFNTLLNFDRLDAGRKTAP